MKITKIDSPYHEGRTCKIRTYWESKGGINQWFDEIATIDTDEIYVYTFRSQLVNLGEGVTGIAHHVRWTYKLK